MKLHILGAARTVTGSMFLLEVNDQKLLIDCGLFQGRRADTYEVNLHFPFDPQEIDAVILSHAHIDHSGNLPNLVKQGYSGPIYTTYASRDLAEIMLLDSGHIHEADAQYVNKLRRKKKLPPVEPLYTQEDALDTVPLFQTVWYEQTFEPLEGVEATLHDAGHILGSASVVLDVTEGGETKRLWFSGDIGRYDTPILRDPVLPEDADYLIMECTYGDKIHEDADEAFAELKDAIIRTERRGGKLIIPAFAIGRTQTLSYYLSEAMLNDEIPNLPVVVDSPLAVSASDLYRKHTECFDEETWRFLAEHRSPALDFENLYFTRSVDESKALNEYSKPMIIISASGMAENGRILHHLKNNIEDGRNTIAIISWQAPYTLGRRLADRERKVRIFGEDYYRKAEVVTIGGLSAHAGQNLLVDYALASAETLEKIIVVHGEEKAFAAFKARLDEHADMPEIAFPEKGEVFEL